MPKLRIGIDAHVLTGKFQGTRTILMRLLHALAQVRLDHEIVIYTDDPAAAQAMIGPSAFSYRDLGHAGSITRLLRVFPRLLREDRIDVAVFQYIAPLAGASKRIVFLHDILPITHPRFFPLLNRLRIRLFFAVSVARSAMVIAVSDYTRRAVEAYYRLAPDRVRTVFNGPSFPPESYSGPHMATQPRYVLTVGRIERRKNVALLVDAFRAANVPDLRLIVVGALDLGFGYAFPHDDPRIEHNVGIDDAALIDLYRGASLFVYPSAGEGFGIPLLDALLFGIPTLSSDQTAMPEIGVGVAAFFDPTSPDAQAILAERIAAHFAGREIPAPTDAQRRALGVRFSWDRAARDFVAAVEAAALDRKA